jgi:TPR repeat protein
VPRQLFSGTAPLARSRHRGGVLAVLAGSTAVFFNRPEESSRTEIDFRVNKGDTMNLHLRHSYSFFSRLLLLAAAFAAVQPSYAAAQSQQNPSMSFSRLQSRAEQGDAVAQYNLAQSYLRHDPTSADYLSALKWLRASSAQGNLDAEFLLGYLYEHGQGVPQDYAQAAENYRNAALQGHSSAENNLASLHQHGQGVPKDMGKAFEWYLASAQHGNPVGQCNLATLYYLGAGTRRDYKEAAKWFRAAAVSGSAEAQNSLGVSYYKGLGVALDYTEAARWLRLAALNGLPGAETNLAYLYEQGRGLPLDYVAAYTWYSRALAAGDASGAGRRNELSHLMTRKQIDEAASLLATFSSQSQQPPSPVVASGFSLLRNH